MGDSRVCTACGAGLVGPFEPDVPVSYVPPAGGERQESIRATTRSWICPGCGLVHWYADDQDLAKLQQLDSVKELEGVEPGSSYERRAQMQRMLRKVRRI
ncbi:MAG: hypothetical protein PVI09_19850 [Anaerolineae bacterium]|jgi:hypothetical protein